MNDEWWRQGRATPPAKGWRVQVSRSSEAAAAQEKVRDGWHHRVKARQHEEMLEPNARECSSCAILERHYEADYVCYRCRAALED